MTIKTDGGPAFPMPGYLDEEGSRVWGISKRDWFAAQALNGILAHPDYGRDGEEGDFLHSEGPRRAAQWAYSLADAMLEARVRRL